MHGRILRRVFTLTVCAALCGSAALAELERDERVPMDEHGRLRHPAITEQNSIYRLCPALRAKPEDALTARELAALIDQFDVARGQGDRDVIGWYEPYTGALRKYTYCNYFAADVAQARGAFLPGGLGCCTVCRRPLADEFLVWYAHGTAEGAVLRVEPESNPVYQTLSARGLVCHGDCEGGQIAYIHLTPVPQSSLQVWLDAVGAQYGWTRVIAQPNQTAEEAAQAAANAGVLTIGLGSGHIIVAHPDVNEYGGALNISEAGARLTDYGANTHAGYAYYSFTGFPDSAAE